jgi:PIN domain nuclease of toxin-antitoxin system
VSVLDAYAVVGFFRGERCADEVATLLRSPTTIACVNAAEVVDQLVRVSGHDPDDVHADLEMLTRAGMTIDPLSAKTALFAGQLRARHYHRDHCAVSLADCIAAATAITLRSPLATSDPALAMVVRAEDGDVHALPDSKGRRP